ncbi:ActS/PrrB/RegB family redox-sensitive histidine kinase [Alphaproteobacteria bacterium KMM 3653]|uniref:histidine kinase n=1 Tax=Harenicola maris TaxID=2841044 RepID=A0AAP2G4B5_9RHOB|nr:ActS/PrrB/RegB family redox-sensitive histidine kinase [Harenicola maris]
MQDSTLGLFDAPGRSHWIRLRTLIVLRWIAIAGQITALVIAMQVVGLQLEIGLCLVAIATSVIANLISMFIFPESRRLSDTEALLMLLFDVSQLAFLVYLCGGLNNPFALLILTPVIIAATTLKLQSVLIIALATIGLTTLVSLFYIPLRDANGMVLAIPPIFAFGFWVALVIGISFTSLYARRVSMEIHAMSDALLATRMALAREQKLTDLGGVVAAAAHELGTPLATIKLVSSEMRDDISDMRHPPKTLIEDIDLIQEQTERCRYILRSMGRAGKDDTHLRQAPLSAIIDEAAEPHRDRGKSVLIHASPYPGGPEKQPILHRRPEIIHGLRNLIQNAVDFAASTIWIESHWTATHLTLRVSDDGPGFPPHLLGRIGDPFVGHRRSAQNSAERPEYEGMGLGLFIAKTLLERSEGELTFANGSSDTTGPRRGAVVELRWPLSTVAVPRGAESLPLGPNMAIKA